MNQPRPKVGQVVVVRMTGRPGDKVFLTLNMPSQAATRLATVSPNSYKSGAKVMAKGVIGADGTTQFQVRISKAGTYSLSGSTPTVRRNVTITVKN